MDLNIQMDENSNANRHFWVSYKKKKEFLVAQNTWTQKYKESY